MYEALKPAEFLKALAEGRLGGEIVQVGVAKYDAKEPNVLLFSEPPMCKNWVKIPVSIIDKVTVISHAYPCGDQEYPLVSVELKRPAADNEFATVLTELLKHGGSGRSQARTLPLGNPPEIIASPSSTTLPLRQLRVRGGGDGGDPVDVSAQLSGSFGLDLIGQTTQPVNVLLEGCITQQSGPVGGAAHFSQPFSAQLPPLPLQRVPFTVTGLQAGLWNVCAFSDLTGPVGPCSARVPGLLYLGVEGGRGPHCGIASFAVQQSGSSGQQA